MSNSLYNLFESEFLSIPFSLKGCSDSLDIDNDKGREVRGVVFKLCRKEKNVLATTVF